MLFEIVPRVAVVPLIVASTLTVAASSGPPDNPRDPVAAAADLDVGKGTIVTAMQTVVGGAYGGVSYHALFDGGRPDVLYLPEGRDVTVTQYFAPLHTYRPDGTPNPDAGVVTYRWQAHCDSRNIPLTEYEKRDVPANPAAHVTRAPEPTLAVTATLRLPPECVDRGFGPNGSSGYVGVRFLGSEDGGWGATGSPWILPAGGQAPPEFDAEFDERGRVLLYRVGDSGEIEDVETSGGLSRTTDGFLRYFFTNCEHARAFRADLLEAGYDAAGILRIPAVPDVAEAAVGVVARKAGASDLVAWGLSEGTGIAWKQAEVIDRKPGEPPTNCGV